MEEKLYDCNHHIIDYETSDDTSSYINWPQKVPGWYNDLRPVVTGVKRKIQDNERGDSRKKMKTRHSKSNIQDLQDPTPSTSQHTSEDSNELDSYLRNTWDFTDLQHFLLGLAANEWEPPLPEKH